jgi:quercetin dioxygenase-like cupin family protein
MPTINTIQSTYMSAGEGHRKRVITELMTIKATGGDTGGAYSLFETETPPSGGFPLHAHRYDDETFYILEGSYSFYLDDRQVELDAGAYVFVPRGTMHGYVNAGSGFARMLVLVTPGGIHEKFLDEIGDSADRPAWQPDMARVLAVAPKYGVDFSSYSVGDETTEAGRSRHNTLPPGTMPNR